MARVFSPFPISGSFGDLTFATNGATTYLKQRNWIPKDKWLNSPKYQRTRENAQTFGGAAKVGAAIYTALTGGKPRSYTPAAQKTIRPYGHNHITKKLIGKGSSKKGRAADTYTFVDALPALRSLDLSHDQAPTHHIRITAIGPHHAPEKIRIQGLKEAAQEILANRPTVQDDRNPHLSSFISHQITAPAFHSQLPTLSFRLQLVTLRFPEVTFDTDDSTWNFTHQGSNLIHRTPWTEWIPIDYIPDQGPTIPLHLPGNTPPCPEACTEETRSALEGLEAQPSSFISVPELVEAQPSSFISVPELVEGHPSSFILNHSSFIPTPPCPEVPEACTEGTRSALEGLEGPTLTFIQIEWQQTTHQGKSQAIPSQAIIHLAAISYSEAIAQELATKRTAHTQHNVRQTNILPATEQPSLTLLSPEQFLKKALSVLNSPHPRQR